VRPLGAPSTRGRRCGRPAVEAGEGIHDGYGRVLPSPGRHLPAAYDPGCEKGQDLELPWSPIAAIATNASSQGTVQVKLAASVGSPLPL
jgi:hypothetical protein